MKAFVVTLPDAEDVFVNAERYEADGDLVFFDAADVEVGRVVDFTGFSGAMVVQAWEDEEDADAVEEVD